MGRRLKNFSGMVDWSKMLAYQQSRPGFIFSGKFVKEITSLLREWKESIIIKHHLERSARCLSFYK